MPDEWDVLAVSLHTMERLKAKFDDLAASGATPEEQRAFLLAVANALEVRGTAILQVIERMLDNADIRIEQREFLTNCYATLSTELRKLQAFRKEVEDADAE